MSITIADIKGKIDFKHESESKRDRDEIFKVEGEIGVTTVQVEFLRTARYAFALID